MTVRQMAKNNCEATQTYPSPLAKNLHIYLRSFCRGPFAAKGAAELAAYFHTNERSVRAAIRDLRLAGIPICSNCSGERESGFFYPRSREETKHTLASLNSRKCALDELINAIEVGLDAEFGQPQLFEMEVF